MNASKRLDGLAAIAEHLKVGTKEARRMIRHRGLPVFKLQDGGTSMWRAYSHEVDSWMAGCAEEWRSRQTRAG